jgi:hypothetical protein
MKKAESKVRYFSIGVLLLAALAGFGSCAWDSEVDPPPPPVETRIGYNTGDLVSVHVVTGTGDRSINTAVVPELVNFYEVVFKDTGNNYYRGTGTAAAGYISVSVPVQDHYEVLLLAGNDDILLAAGYEDDQNITAGIANDVTINLTTITPQWTKTNLIASDHFVFAASIANNDGSDSVIVNNAQSYIQVAPYEDPDDIGEDVSTNGYLPGAADTFSVTYKSSVLTPLIAASGTADTVYISGYQARLLPVWAKDVLNGVTAIPLAPTTAFVDADNGSGIKLTIPATTGVTVSTTAGALPTKDVDLALDFKLFYSAFGEDTKGFSSWTIKNGINSDKEDDTVNLDGSIFAVKIGQGTSATETTVRVIGNP